MRESQLSRTGRMPGSLLAADHRSVGVVKLAGAAAGAAVSKRQEPRAGVAEFIDIVLFIDNPDIAAGICGYATDILKPGTLVIERLQKGAAAAEFRDAGVVVISHPDVAAAVYGDVAGRIELAVAGAGRVRAGRAGAEAVAASAGGAAKRCKPRAAAAELLEAVVPL